MKNSSVVSRVQEEAMGARSEGVNGVPFFNIQLQGEDQKIASFSGAQPPETFKTIFQRLLTRLKGEWKARTQFLGSRFYEAHDTS